MSDLTQLTLLELIQDGKDVRTYRGRRRGNASDLIVKLARDEHPLPRTSARLRHEHALLGRLGLEGTPRAVGLELHEGRLALLLELMPGRPLDSILREGRMRPLEAVQMALNLARILEEVHLRRVVHKDIKPANILLDQGTGRVSLVDFGIASELPRGIERSAAPGAFEGTPAYMSPEQMGLVDRWVDARSDLYSLGATLYEALTGAPPFVDAEPSRLSVDVLTRMPPPPHERAEGVPAALSAIVMKALAKSPEERYQSTRGLRADLEACLPGLRAGGTVAPFPLGRGDVVTEPRPPQGLHGRAAELAAFLAAFERVAQGSVELVLVSGEAGIGKSALIREIRRSIVQRGGTLIEGKCDQLESARPYSSITRAIRDLVRKLLAAPEDVLAELQRRLAAALGALAGVLTELCPELAHIVGPQPEAPALGAAEAQNRLALLVRRFFHAFTADGRPLVLFLDDLQWADRASLGLVRGLLEDPDRGRLLLVGGHRDVGADHPLALFAAEARAAGIAPVELRLGALDAAAMAELVADALGGDRRALSPLSALVHEKTAGNPFFAGQFLAHLHGEGLLRFDAEAAGWVFDAAAIARLPGTENVLELLAGQLGALPERSRRALSRAACLGHRFELGTLAAVCQATRRETAAALRPALRRGLVLALDAEHRFYEDEGGAPEGDDFDVAYRFLHDRVQQAAYELIDAEERQRTHLEIGRLLLASAPPEEEDRAPFDAVHHLGLGAALITDDAERLSVARIHLKAGRAARRAAAFEAADRHLAAGAALLGARGFDLDRDLAYALGQDGAECAFLAGDAERAERGYDALFERASSALERAEIERQRMALCATRGRYADALAAGRRGLSLLGAELPAPGEETRAALMPEIARAQAALSAVRMEELVAAPLCSDPELRAVARLLVELFPVAFVIEPELNVILAARHVALALERGHTELSPYAYVTFGSVCTMVLAAHEQALALGQLAMELVARHGGAGLVAQLTNIFGALIAHHMLPLGECIDVLDRGIREGMEAGELQFVGYNRISVSGLRMLQGQELDSLLHEIDRHAAFLAQTRAPLSEALHLVTRQLARQLAGRTPGGLSDDSFDEEAFAEQIERSGLRMVQRYFHAARAMARSWVEDWDGALASSAESSRFADMAVGNYYPRELVFYAALARVARRQESGAWREGDEAALEGEIAELTAFARWCPASFEHKRALILAERARAMGEALEAMEGYERAMARARESGMHQYEALAAERCAGMCLARGWTAAGAAHVARAYVIYTNLGYEVRSQRIAARHEKLLHRAGSPVALSGRLTTSTTMSTTTIGVLGVSVALEAAEALGSEIELDRLLSRLMGLVMAGGAAQRAALVLARGDGLVVEADATSRPDRIAVGLGVSLEAYEDLPRSIVHYVERTREPVRLAYAPEDERFAADPYMAARAPRSILCIPLLTRGRSIGALYVENRDVRGAFTGPRADLLQVLSHQAAISIENARLYTEVRATGAALERANASLEEEAARRAVALREATQELSRTNERLRQELAERERIEASRAALQEQVIRAQRARLEELSTPLIPITDRIMVMPLIGTVDPERAGRVLEAALHGVSAQGAAVLILDVTGVTSLDADVARVLLDTATALRLLGAEAVITGIRPAAAQTLVAVGADLSAIATRGTLQAAIAYALRLASIPESIYRAR